GLPLAHSARPFGSLDSRSGKLRVFCRTALAASPILMAVHTRELIVTSGYPCRPCRLSGAITRRLVPYRGAAAIWRAPDPQSPQGIPRRGVTGAGAGTVTSELTAAISDMRRS